MNQVTDEQILKAAKVAHETNRAWCEANGDFSQPKWEDAPEWQKDSAIQGMWFHFHNPDAGDSASHDNWSREKIAAGWEWGEVKDPDANPPTHPCLVPFNELPIEQQKKDALFRSVAHQLLDIKPHAGLPVKGYQSQSQVNVDTVNLNKQLEELVLTQMDAMVHIDIDPRWLAIARTNIELGFMAMNRAVFKPERVELENGFQGI